MTAFSQLKQLFYDKIIALNPNIIPDIEGSDTYFMANATAQIGAQLIQDVTRVKVAIIPSAGSGTELDREAGSLGMPPRQPSLPSLGTITLTANTGTTAAATFTLTAGTQLINNVNGQTYFVLKNTLINSGTTLANVTIEIQSINLGSLTYSAIGSVLEFSNPVVINGSQSLVTGPVTAMTIGADQETDEQLSYRIFDFMVNPRGGGSLGDYKKWCFLGNPNVTWAEVITTYSDNEGILFPVIFTGSSNPNDYIDVAFPISRAPIDSVVVDVQTYVDGVRPVNDNPEVIPAVTYGIQAIDPVFETTDNSMEVLVTLPQGISLATNITLADGTSKTVEELIIQETRVGVLSTKPFGTLFDFSGSQDYYISIDNIKDVVSLALADTPNLQGTLASLLTSIKINYFENGSSTPTEYIKVPSNINGKLINFQTVPTPLTGAYLVYDIDPTIISVGLVT